MGSEVCDDGNTDSGDGCSQDCKTIEQYWDCATPGSLCIPLCGDGYVFAIQGEECDDNNLINGDGCSNVCIKELSYDCQELTPLDKSVCTPICGDGKT